MEMGHGKREDNLEMEGGRACPFAFGENCGEGYTPMDREGPLLGPSNV